MVRKWLLRPILERLSSKPFSIASDLELLEQGEVELGGFLESILKHIDAPSIKKEVRNLIENVDFKDHLIAEVSAIPNSVADAVKHLDKLDDIIEIEDRNAFISNFWIMYERGVAESALSINAYNKLNLFGGRSE